MHTPTNIDGLIMSSSLHNMPQKYHKYASLTKLGDEVLQNHALVFNVEETLLKSSSMFPYFILVAFEGGGFLRALILLLLYPFLCFIWEEMRLKILVFVCFFGIRRDKFRIGTTVLPKYFLENVGYEGLEVMMKFVKKVGVSNLPRAMVESFLVDYLGVEDVVAREIKVIGGYYIGLMDNSGVEKHAPGQIFAGLDQSQIIGFGSANISHRIYPFTYCKEIYLVKKADKEKWHYLPRDKYPKPLIFHDGRLAFKPSPLASLAMFMWLPFGIILCFTRLIVALLLPYELSTPMLAFLGASYSSSKPLLSNKHDRIHNNDRQSKNVIYVSNHKTVLDPVYVSYICRVHLTAITYGVSRSTKLISPIKTVALARDREKDAELMRRALSEGSIFICPEGTTCREPYLLRFSPLFAEISDDIILLAIQINVSMFHGTTASGIKALDPFFFLLNPRPYYYVKFLGMLPKEWTCGAGGLSKFGVANHVQGEIGRALVYECTGLTRKDKYTILAGNTGVVKKSK